MEDFRALVFAGIRQALKEHPGKPYEGAVSLAWPSIYAAERGSPKCSLRLSCSVFGGGHHFAWSGRTWPEVFARATADVEAWIAELRERPQP